MFFSFKICFGLYYINYTHNDKAKLPSQQEEGSQNRPDRGNLRAVGGDDRANGGDHDTAQEVDHGMHGHTPPQVIRAGVHVGQDHTQEKSVEELEQVAVEQAEQEPRKQDGGGIPVAAGAVNE